MLRKFVTYYVAGWDDYGKMNFIPIVSQGIETKLYNNERPFIRYVEETPLQAASRAGMVLSDVSDIMEDRHWGPSRTRGFYIQDGIIKATSLAGIKEGILCAQLTGMKHEKALCS
jgi:hypothetical protein